MAATRKRLTGAEKEAIVKTTPCYLCADLGLDHAGFEGYEMGDIDFDHYMVPFGNVGGENSTAVLPIHSAAKGSTPDDDGFEQSKRRNCHALKGADYKSRESFVKMMGIRLAIRNTSFIDDVGGNAGRNPKETQYSLPVTWNKDDAQFMGAKFRLVKDELGGKRWERFLVTLPTRLVFTDKTSQVRPATKKKLQALAKTFAVDGYPMFSPVNARIDKCGHVVVFDGNHRGTAWALAFGLDDELPLLIWNIEPGDVCALESPAVWNIGKEEEIA